MGLVADNISFCYQQNVILSEINLTISPSKTVLITGRSGCGKSTLCYLLAGIYPRHAGRLITGKVLIDGQDIHQLSIAERAKLVAIMFQNPDLQFCMDSVENELIFCLENLATPAEIIKDKINDAINFCEIEHLRHRLLHTLSGGEKQLVMLACIIVLESKYIFLDEPFANLDPVTAKAISQKLLAHQQQKQSTLIIVDHQMEPFIDIVDEIIILDKQGKVLHRNIKHNSPKQLHQVLLNLGIAVPNVPYHTNKITSNKSTNKQPLFRLQNVSAPHSRDAVTTEFIFNKMTVITGKSGCGKTTLLETLARMRPYKGLIQLMDNETKKWQNINKIRLKNYAAKVGIIFQNPQDQFIANTVYDEMYVSLDSTYTDKIEQQKLIQDYLQQIGLWDYRDLSPYMLSQGQQRLLAVTALLACNCRILLCDEPTYGLDRQTATTVMNMLQTKVNTEQLTVIFTTHDKQLANDYGDIWYHYANNQLINVTENRDIYA